MSVGQPYIGRHVGGARHDVLALSVFDHWLKNLAGTQLGPPGQQFQTRQKYVTAAYAVPSTKSVWYHAHDALKPRPRCIGRDDGDGAGILNLDRSMRIIGLAEQAIATAAGCRRRIIARCEIRRNDHWIE